MIRIRERKKEQAREAIVDAATRLFAERGIQATSIDDIADAVDVSRATVFNYFPYKEAILVEIGARLVVGIAEQTAGRRRRSLRNALYDLADAVATVAEQFPTVVPYIAREMTHPDPARRAYATDRMQYPALYEAILAELARTARLRSPGRRAALGRQLVDLTTGALVRAGNEDSVSGLRRALRANVDLFWEGAVVTSRPVRAARKPGRQSP